MNKSNNIRFYLAKLTNLIKEASEIMTLYQAQALTGELDGMGTDTKTKSANEQQYLSFLTNLKPQLEGLEERIEN